MRGDAIELVIFDCDGVLVDSEPIANRIWAEIVTVLGFPMTWEDAVREFAGRTRSDNLEIIEKLIGRPPPVGLGQEYETKLFAALERDLRPIAGVVQALDQIALPMCVASSAGPAKVRLTLELTGLLSRFEGNVFSGADVRRGKPHPDLFLYAAEQMGFSPGGCAVVEDSLPGVRAGIAAGMTVLGYGGFTNPEALEQAGARVFVDMEELPQLLTALNEVAR